jgi:hypothetical protein
MALDHRFRGCKAPRKADPFWRRSSESSTDRISYEEPRPHLANLSGVRIVMKFMDVHVVELLCHTAIGRILALECLFLDAHGASGCVLSCLMLNDHVS